MTRLTLRIVMMVVGAALVLFALAAAYIWYLGSDLITRGKHAGWAVAESEAPLSLFEQTAAKVLFAESWNRTGFPCRTAANALTGTRTPMSVSALVARDIQMEVGPDRTLESHFTRLSAACQLEVSHSDTALLRLWLSHFSLAGRNNVEDAARELFGKPSNQLSEIESARLVALLGAPNAWQSPDRWTERADHLLARAQRYVWNGDRPELKDAKP
jgi:hypothetical protein